MPVSPPPSLLRKASCAHRAPHKISFTRVIVRALYPSSSPDTPICPTMSLSCEKSRSTSALEGCTRATRGEAPSPRSKARPRAASTIPRGAGLSQLGEQRHADHHHHDLPLLRHHAEHDGLGLGEEWRPVHDCPELVERAGDKFSSTAVSPVLACGMEDLAF